MHCCSNPACSSTNAVSSKQAADAVIAQDADDHLSWAAGRRCTHHRWLFAATILHEIRGRRVRCSQLEDGCLQYGPDPTSLLWRFHIGTQAPLRLPSVPDMLPTASPAVIANCVQTIKNQIIQRCCQAELTLHSYVQIHTQCRCPEKMPWQLDLKLIDLRYSLVPAMELASRAREVDRHPSHPTMR